ncbi:hypothetical protein [Paraflavitalea speifideaquila]|uniref:hypothetical protein n=1 Tax=Paraflavitalea speifideaquila TaxID=3076558 RepID=UPI0028E9DA02|nr:hypothetical protein [Paraflavitalea speifideiaquila]
MKDQDRIWTLVARKLAGEASWDERKELELLLHKYPEMTYTVEMLLNLWAQEKPAENDAAEEAFDRLMQKMTRKRNNQRMLLRWPAVFPGKKPFPVGSFVQYDHEQRRPVE